MNKFEERLLELEVPETENYEFQNKLRQKLKHKYFSIERKYKKRYKLVTAFTCLLVIFIISVILKPKIVDDINRFAFQKEKIEGTSKEEELVPIDNFIRQTSIYNPKLVNKINPTNYQEEKAYIIRKYVSSKNGNLMIISEFDQDKPKRKKLISMDSH
ncbi:MAG TPA: hypothetical protein ENL20_03545 [Candidatus Cloacimonetes bacterium]|nr:hypothetical protein [Candidatus Cloacimonadota bacterium]